MTTDALRNGFLQVAIRRDGAELTSVTDPDGTEYLWQGDPRIWDCQSPILFPIVGRLAGDAYSYAGRDFSLPQHGFARRRAFDLVERGGGRLSYALQADAGTRAAYPFEFSLTVTYTLEANSIHVGYRVLNPGSVPLPFSIGGHPGLSCSRGPGEALEDCSLEFERPEVADTRVVRSGLVAVDETRRILSGEATLPLTSTLFESGALVLMNLASSAVRLRSRRHAAVVEVGFPGFPCLGVWSKPGAPFVCIEPWFGHADPEGRSPGSPIETKPGIMLLQPRRTFACAWRLSITPSPVAENPGTFGAGAG